VASRPERTDRAKRWNETVAAYKAYDTQDFVEQCGLYGITSHVAQNTSRTSAIDERTTRTPATP